MGLATTLGRLAGMWKGIYPCLGYGYGASLCGRPCHGIKMLERSLPQTDPPISRLAGPASANPPPCISPASFWPPLHVVESAWLEHAPFAFWLVEALQPRSLVELGTHNGFSFLALSQAVQRMGLSTACYAVDTWEGDKHAGFYGEEVYAQFSSTVGRHYAAFSRLLRCRFDQALPYFPDGSIDLLHIDGRHTFDDVLEDFESWRPKLSDRAVVLFHDTNVRERDFGVWRLWHSLSQQYPSFEFLHGHGLGVLAVGPQMPDRLRPLVQAGPEAVNAIRAAYAHLGNAVSHRYQLELVHRAIGEAGAERHRLQAELATQADILAAVRHEAEQSRAALQVAEATLTTTRAELATVKAGLSTLARQDAELRKHAEEQHQGLQSVQNARAELDSRHAALQSAFCGLSAQAAATQQNLTLIQQSTFWRATQPLRSGLAKVPQPVRNLLRRGAKAVWWAVTPHRIPARIAFLRARRKLLAGQTEKEQINAVEPQLEAALVMAAVTPRHLAFHPAPPGSGPELPADRNGHYTLEPREAGYVYVPPRRPHDLEQRLAVLATQARFSIVVPTYNTTTDLLSRMLASVLAQWYPYWELILADDASPKPETRDFLRGIDDPRVRVLFLEHNRGISGATNAALEQAQGNYVVFLDHDDELTEDCLWELALRIAQDDPDFVYSDEDKIDEQGRFCQPFFKPDWSPDTMMSTMFTCHVSCVRRSLLQEVGPLNPEFDGAQDWDLILRVTERTQRIVHVPKVLYHWRIIPASVAADLAAKPYAVEAGRRCREAALRRRGLQGVMEPVEQVFGYFNTRYTVQGNPLISVIIPSRNNGPVLLRCVDSLRRADVWRNLEVIILDNGSDKADTLAILRGLADQESTQVIRHDAPFNYSELNNIGARTAHGDLLLFLNDDTELVTPDGLERLAGYAQLPHVAAVGAKLLYPQTLKVQHVGVVNLAVGPCHALLQENADAPGYFMRNLLEYNWAAVTGACLMIERGKFEAVGGFDESFPVAYNDVELCFRLLKQGLYHVVCPSVRLLHHESLSRGQDHATPERRARLDDDRYRLYAAHPDMLMHDPFHSPNLHPEDVHFTVPA